MQTATSPGPARPSTPARPMRPITASLAACMLLALVGSPAVAADDAAITLVRDGKAQMPIIAQRITPPVMELRNELQRISDAIFPVEQPVRGRFGLHVGVASDFPWLRIDDVQALGPEGFVIRTDELGVYLIAHKPAGVQHAVTTFLHRLGCRWYFPGDAWEIIPQRRTLAGRWNERHAPDFPTQRRIWYGFGAYAEGRADHDAWVRRNRMGGVVDVSIGHTWHGLNPDRDFAQHPEWFALVDGERKPSKPCYSHARVIETAIASALKQAAAGTQMVTMTPPDGLGYCECDKCQAALGEGERIREHNTLFARRADGTLVNITSETLFAMVNKVAAAVAAEHPDTLIGCYAYSAYSHPPTFDLHPNVYLQTTTAFRRTSLTLEQQLAAFGRKTRQLGIREYYSVYQWDWDYPDPGKMTPAQLQEDLRFFRDNGVTAVNAEASNNWAPRGLGYYVASQLLWDTDADVKDLVRDFYEQAFGAAAPAMQRYYVRWYGPSVAALPGSADLPEKSALYEKNEFNADALAAALRDLDEAARLVRDDAPRLRRVNLLRMYAHYLALRYRLHQAEQSGDPQRIREAIREETIFGGRLTDTHMIHTRPLLGKAFLRRFHKHEALLKDVEAAQQHGEGWRQIGEPPTDAELERLLKEDRKLLGLR